MKQNGKQEKATKQPVLIQGVRLELVKMAVVDAALTAHSLPIGGTDVQKIDRLAVWFRKNVDKKKLADCQRCGGVSDVTEVCCPFCGDGDKEEDVTPHPEQLAAVKSTQLATVVPIRSIEPVYTETDLDKAIAKVHEHKTRASCDLWELGDSIRSIFDLGLWKLRKNDDGAPAYKTWGLFCEQALGITPAYGYRLIDVSKAFSKEEVQKVGATKLYVTLQVPPDRRAKLVEAAKEGATKAELLQMAEAEGKEKRETGRTDKGGAGTHKEPTVTGGRPKEKITVAMLIERVEIPLFKGASDKRARSLADLPRGEERIVNSVKQHFVVTKDENGDLILVVERTREA